MDEAIKELLAYGYVQDGDDLVRTKNGKVHDKFVVSDGGFLRFDRDDGAWVAVPHSLNERGEGLAGLTFEKHPEFFDMVYPASEIVLIYGTANAA